jgi:hypothetical protein
MSHKKEAGRKVKQKSVSTDLQRMCIMKYVVIPAIIGATGIGTDVLKKNLQIVPGKHSLRFSRTTVVRGTSHMIPKVLQSVNGMLGFGYRGWFKRGNTRDKRPETRGNEIIIIIIIIIMRQEYDSKRSREDFEI